MNQAIGAATVPNTSVIKERKEYTGVAKKLMNLLASGASQVEASTACGVVEGYTSQLMAEPDFKEQVREKLETNFEEASKIDTNYQILEKTATERLVKGIEFEFNNDRLLRIAKFANEAKRKLAPNSQNGGPGVNGEASGQKIAVLVLPTFLIEAAQARELQVNPNNEVVAVAGKQLTTFDSKGMDKLVAAKNMAQTVQVIKEALKPNGSKAAKPDPYANL